MIAAGSIRAIICYLGYWVLLQAAALGGSC